jgi:GNAT superfamily N-acetyltransferase
MLFMGRRNRAEAVTAAPGDIEIRREDLTSATAGRLIAALNAELEAQYPEPGANFFRLDPGEVGDGRGAFFVVYAGGTPVGCGAIRLLDPRTAEIKRMYVDRGLRKQGIARRMLAALEAEARALGATRAVLETGTRQSPALNLYEAAGYARIACWGEYADAPLSLCMEKNLTDGGEQ